MKDYSNAFQYLTVEPVAFFPRATDGEMQPQCFTSLEAFEACRASASDVVFRVIGIQGGDNRMAIAEYSGADGWVKAFALVHAFEATLAQFRDALNDAVSLAGHPGKGTGIFPTAAADVANDIEDVINQCSNEERL